MPAERPKRWLSLDTGIAVRLGEELETAHLFHELARERGFRLFLVPTALAELDQSKTNREPLSPGPRRRPNQTTFIRTSSQLSKLRTDTFSIRTPR